MTHSDLSDIPHLPTLPWRLASSAVMGAMGLICKGYLYGLNHVTVTGLEHLTDKLDEHRAGRRERGLLTISNHVSVYVCSAGGTDGTHHTLTTTALTIPSSGVSSPSGTSSTRP